jgi:hypothetical protein
MAPLFFSLGNRLQLMIICDTDAHLDGQNLVTKTYSIFRDMALRDPRQSKSKEGTLHLERINDPEYYGFLSLLAPDSTYIYTANGLKQLSEDELEQLIEQLNPDNRKI